MSTSIIPQHYGEASGYEADAERGISEEEEDMRMLYHSATSMDGTMSTTSTNDTLAAGPARRDCTASLMNLAGRRKGARNKSHSSSSSNSFSSTTTSKCSSSFPASEAQFQGGSGMNSVAVEDSEDAVPGMFAGNTCCRHHGQYPRRHRNFQVGPQYAPWATKKPRAHKASRKTNNATHKQPTSVLFRGGIVRGMAANLNDSNPLTTLPENNKSHAQNEPYCRLTVSFKLPAVYLSSLSTPGGSKIEELPLDAIGRTCSVSMPPPIHQRLPYLVAPAPCSIEEALSFSPHARYVHHCVLMRLLVPAPTDS
jgi:hypothetical protein